MGGVGALLRPGFLLPTKLGETGRCARQALGPSPGTQSFLMTFPLLSGFIPWVGMLPYAQSQPWPFPFPCVSSKTKASSFFPFSSFFKLGQFLICLVAQPCPHKGEEGGLEEKGTLGGAELPAVSMATGGCFRARGLRNWA